MKSKKVIVEFEINQNGCPIVSAEMGAFATAQFASARSDQSRDRISIVGNREGLLTLARWMIALADEESCLDHQHFDREVDFGLYASETDCELIISRVGNRPQTRNRRYEM